MESPLIFISDEVTYADTSNTMGLQKEKIVIYLKKLEHCLFQRVFLNMSCPTAAYLINRLPSRISSGISPARLLANFFPSAPIMSSLQNRCSSLDHVHGPQRGKLDPQAFNWSSSDMLQSPDEKNDINVITLLVVLPMSP